MAYSSGSSAQVIVGAAAFFVALGTGELKTSDLPVFVAGESYAESLSDTTPATKFRNVGYTTDGLEVTFQPDFGEVQVDQSLDSVRLYRQGMQVSMKTAFAEATLENLLVAIAAPEDSLSDSTTLGSPDSTTAGTTKGSVMELTSGQLGGCPVERGLIAVGPGTGDCTPANNKERVYVARRALSIESVTLSAKRDAPSSLEVNFRLLPNSKNSYGRIVDRIVGVKEGP